MKKTMGLDSLPITMATQNASRFSTAEM